MTLVSDSHAMAAMLRRLHALNDAVTFWNEQRTFKLMVRNDPVDPETLACELVLVTDEDDDSMVELMALMSDGYLEEPGTFVLDTWSFSLDTFSAEDAARVAKAVNDAYGYRVCPCGKYLIKDDAGVCLYCQMTASAADRTSHFCPICCEEGREMHMTRMPCCSNHLHTHCLATWHHKSGDDRCPLCRQLGDVAVPSRPVSSHDLSSHNQSST